jgi:hypothetical protein
MIFSDYIPIKNHSKLFALLVCACVIICVLICFIMMSYFFLFVFKKNMNNYTIFNEYTPSSKIAIEKYGDNKIVNAYLVTEPLHIFYLFLYKALSFSNSCDCIKNVRHTTLLLEVEINKNENKLILIDKTNCINIFTEFKMNDKYTVVPIQLKKKSKSILTLRKVLDETYERIGKRKFFNWHVYKNNCNYFIDNMIKTINKDFVYDKFFFKNKKEIKKIFHNTLYSTFRVRLWYSSVFLFDFITKYFDVMKTYLFNEFLNTIYNHYFLFKMLPT